VHILSTDAPKLPQAGARCKHVALVLMCARAEGAVRGVKDTVVMERGSGACSAMSKDPEEHFDLIWCKAIPVHLSEWRRRDRRPKDGTEIAGPDLGGAVPL
jgi:hypothetical protein